MSRSSDFSYEMTGELPLDDALAPFAEEIRFAVSGPPPEPSLALAAVLAGGFCGISPTDKGDLLVTAASNVHGPAPQVAGLPKWKKEIDMPVSGVLASLLAKISGVGTAAKAAVASATAVATIGLAGGAAGVLPGPAQSLVAAAVGATTPFEFPDGYGVTDVVDQAVPALPQLPAVDLPGTPATPPVSATGSVSAKAGTTSASASGAAKTASPGSAPAALPGAPGLPGVPALPGVTIPPAVSNLVKGIPACVTNLIPTGGTAPDPTKLVSQIPTCITQVLGTASLAPDVAKCVASVLGTIGGASGMSTAAVLSIGSLNVSACVPLDATKCVSSMLGLLATIPGAGTGGIPGLGSLSNLAGLPGISSVTGCVPMNVTACLTSLAGAASAGTTPKLDLSACMPTALPTSGLPGVGSLPGRGSLPGVPFFG